MPYSLLTMKTSFMSKLACIIVYECMHLCHHGNVCSHGNMELCISMVMFLSNMHTPSGKCHAIKVTSLVSDQNLHTYVQVVTMVILTYITMAIHCNTRYHANKCITIVTFTWLNVAATFEKLIQLCITVYVTVHAKTSHVRTRIKIHFFTPACSYIH